MHNKKGITVVEMVAVIGVLAILASICIPCFGNLYKKSQDISLNTSTKELLCDLRLMQQKANSEDCIYHIYFNTLDNSYMIYSYRDMQNCVFKQKKLPAGIRYDNIRSTYQDNKISFNSKGKPLPYPCTVSLINNVGQYKRITITVETDYISIKDQ